MVHQNVPDSEAASQPNANAPDASSQCKVEPSIIPAESQNLTGAPVFDSSEMDDVARTVLVDALARRAAGKPPLLGDIPADVLIQQARRGREADGRRLPQRNHRVPPVPDAVAAIQVVVEDDIPGRVHRSGEFDAVGALVTRCRFAFQQRSILLARWLVEHTEDREPSAVLERWELAADILREELGRYETVEQRDPFADPAAGAA